MPPVIKKVKKPIQNKSEDEEVIKGEEVISAQLQKRLDRKEKTRRKRPERGVVLIRHLPHGFFEEQLKNYFEQFGLVTRLRLARSRKTGGAKGFAFVEYAIPEVAKIAAETMDNYLMFKKIVQAHYIPPEEQKFNYFKSKVKQVTTPLGKDIFISGKTKLARYKVTLNNKWNQYNYEKRTKNAIKKLNKLKKKYADLGLDFDDITIAPKLLPHKVTNSDEKTEKTDDETVVNTSEELSEDNNEPGSLLLVKKRKRNLIQKDNIKIPKLTTSSNKIELKQLLDKTLEDESSSEDEDYLPTEEEVAEIPKLTTSSDKIKLKQLLDKTLEDESSSEDEDYLPTKEEEEELKENFLKELKEIKSEDDSDEIDEADETITDLSDEEDISSDDNENEDIEKPVKKQFAKSNDHLEKIIRRTPHLGGIQKSKNKILKPKSTKNSTVNTAKDKMKNIAAKEILKSTKIKTLKKADLKKKKQK